MKYYKQLNNKTECNLCPRKCLLSKGQSGFCKAIENTGNSLEFAGYGYSSGFAVDPIEKKPLYHFYPSSKVLSFGTFGCNMGCTFCQNHHISKVNFDVKKSVKATPEQVVQTAIDYKCKSIAFTYNDPVVFFDYAIEIAKLAKKNNVKTVAVTAGYILPEPRKDFFQYIDAVNIDLKSFDENFYKQNCFANIQYIKDTIEYVANETDCELELTTLLIEDKNTDSDILNREFEWIVNKVGCNIPVHLSAFHPAYKMIDIPKTSIETILRAVDTAKNQGLLYVYSGNIPHIETSLTACPNCKYKLVERNGYQVRITGLNGNKCVNCGQEIYGRF